MDLTGELAMLYDQLPLGVLALMMGICCAVKHMALRRLALTRSYQNMALGRYWLLAVSAMACTGGGLIYLAFDRFVGLPRSAVAAGLDAGLNFFMGLYARRIKYFELSNEARRLPTLAVRLVYLVAYSTYIWISLG